MRPLSRLARAPLLALAVFASAACRARPTPAPLAYAPCTHGADMPSGPPRVELDPEPPDSAGRLRGLVWDHTEEWLGVGVGQSITGAHVLVRALGETAPAILAFATSDHRGHFTLSVPLPDGRFELVTRRIGLTARTDTITVPMVPGHRLRLEMVKPKSDGSCRVIRMP